VNQTMNEEIQLAPSSDGSDDAIQPISEERPTPCQFLTGRAGTGKSYQVMQRAQADPDWAMVTATTGIAAVNLGAVTINSILKYFDTLSMRDAFLQGHLTRILHKIAKRKKWFLVEEASMLEEDQLDYLYRAVGEANMYGDIKSPMGIMLVGDFAQLPPVSGKWAFSAACWKEFAAQATRLTKVWRQSEGPFLEALNLARMGQGGPCAELLTAAGIEWHSARVVEFDGTTILCKNDMVRRHNQEVLKKVQGDSLTVAARRWGQQRAEWGENPRTHEWGIPPKMELKLGAYVMILANNRDFSMVNGDCGYIRQYDAENEMFTIELVRTGKEIQLSKLVRDVATYDQPANWDGERLLEMDGPVGWYPHPHAYTDSQKYVLGQIEYFPMRLAYASTCHKAQGLTLDRVQVDLRDRFWQAPAMSYVALSRCRTLEGLRMVINKDSFVRQVQMDARVRPWL
jgi:ATP-dependent DNA helicase PIF1